MGFSRISSVAIGDISGLLYLNYHIHYHKVVPVLNQVPHHEDVSVA